MNGIRNFVLFVLVSLGGFLGSWHPVWLFVGAWPSLQLPGFQHSYLIFLSQLGTTPHGLDLVHEQHNKSQHQSHRKTQTSLDPM